MDTDVLLRTVKFRNANSYGTVSMANVVEVLKIAQLSPEDVETISRGMGDKEVSVVLRETNLLKNLGKKLLFL